MKKYKLFLVGALLCGSTYAGYSAYQNATMTEYDKMITANLEALVKPEINESEYQYCRCKVNDEGVNDCYGGNALSFRANCGKSDNNGELIDCSGREGQCRN